MDSPEFAPDKKKILLFSRGRGRAHAICDMEIAAAIHRLASDVDLRFVSYGTGAGTLKRHGVSHIDLKFPDDNPINETIVAAGRLIGWLDPDLVVAHEEFSALPAAKIFSKPTVLITDWFTEPDRLSMGSLRMADQILFLEEQGIYPEPSWVKGKVRYLGPLLRRFNYRRADRGRAREEMGVAADALVLAVLPGSWRESVVPILDTVVAAYQQLPQHPKYLIWVAGADAEYVRERIAGMENALVLDYEPEIDRVMVAADMAITKGNRRTLLELDSLGVPSLSFENTNPIDMFRARSLPGTHVLPHPVSPGGMYDAIVAALSAEGFTMERSAESDTACLCAELILGACRGD